MSFVAKTKVQKQSNTTLLANVTARMKQPRKAEAVRVEERKKAMVARKKTA
jgi:hypothetical protein